MKRFDCEDEPNEFMEMPCMCDCGKWFDLTDGYRSKNSNGVICKECYLNENQEPDFDKEEEEVEFNSCEDCELLDVCEEFGCEIKSGFRKAPLKF